MAATDELIEDLVDLWGAERASRGEPRARIHRVAERRRRAVGDGVPKATAARALGVSAPTLDKWIARGRLHTIADPRTGRRQVSAAQLVPLIFEVRALRRGGQRDAVLAQAIATLERRDPAYQQTFVDLYGESLRAAAAGDLAPVTVPDTFGPED